MCYEDYLTYRYWCSLTIKCWPLTCVYNGDDVYVTMF